MSFARANIFLKIRYIVYIHVRASYAAWKVWLKAQRVTIHPTAKIFCILHITLLPCVAPSSRPQSMVGNHRCRAALAVCIFVYTAGILLFSSTSWQRNPNRTCAHTELLSCSPVRLSINYMWGCLAENISNALFQAFYLS